MDNIDRLSAKLITTTKEFGTHKIPFHVKFGNRHFFSNKDNLQYNFSGLNNFDILTFGYSKYNLIKVALKN